MLLTAKVLRDALVAIPDDALIAIQDANNPALAQFLDGLTACPSHPPTAAEATRSALIGLLNCAELNQDDLEPETVELIENAAAAIRKTGWHGVTGNTGDKTMKATATQLQQLFDAYLAAKEEEGLESDDFLPGQDVTIDAARELFLDVIAFNTSSQEKC